MDKYTIYCTPEQTKKALELGAPIEEHGRYHADLEPNIVMTAEKTWLEIPTAEQMCGWLRAQGFQFKFAENDDECIWQYRIGDWFKYGICSNHEEATIAAIDAALEYLTNKQ